MAFDGEALGAAFRGEFSGLAVELAELADGGEALGVQHSNDVHIGAPCGKRYFEDEFVALDSVFVGC